MSERTTMNGKPVFTVPSKTVIKRHPNFKGSSINASHGYKLVFVGKAHHLADVRGYAYEHRMVAEQILGRRLEARECVHHINGNKSDNRPENLQIEKSHAHHKAQHRKRSDMKEPDAPNPVAVCACGCGQTFQKFDSSNRPRKYAVGHAMKGKKRTWESKSYSRLGEQTRKLHLAQMRHNRWNTDRTESDLHKQKGAVLL